MLNASFFSPVPPYARAESFPRRSVRSASARPFSSFSLSCARLSRRSHQLHHSLQIVRERGKEHLHPRPLHSQVPYPRHPAPALHRTKRRFHSRAHFRPRGVKFLLPPRERTVSFRAEKNPRRHSPRFQRAAPLPRIVRLVRVDALRLLRTHVVERLRIVHARVRHLHLPDEMRILVHRRVRFIPERLAVLSSKLRVPVLRIPVSVL